MLASLRIRTLVAFVTIGTALGAHLAVAPAARAQEEEARLLFERGNQHLAAGLRARGRRRTAELSEALDAYLGVLRLGARTRNVVFNLGLTQQELGRNDEAFNYYSEYLRTFDLTADERAEGSRRLDQLRPSVAVAAIASNPEGASVRVDRRDLPVRGVTPIELAVPAGAHTIYLELEGYEPAQGRLTAVVGQTASLEQALEAQPVSLQVIAPARGELTLDDQPIVAGRAVPVAPGPHVVRLTMVGAPVVERRFEVRAGGEPMVLELSGAAGAGGPTIALSVDVPGDIFLDNIRVGAGSRLELPALPGPHLLRVVAPGRATATHRFTLADAPLSFDVTMGAEADNTGLHIGRGLLGIPAALGVVASVITVSTAISMSVDWKQELAAHNADAEPGMSAQQLEDYADRVEGWLLAADVALGITAALGVAALVLVAIPDAEGEESSVEVVAAPSLGGGMLMARARWGDR